MRFYLFEICHSNAPPDDAQSRDRIDLRRSWVKTVEPGPEQAERSFWLADGLVLARTTGISPRFAAIDHSPSIYQGTFVYNIGVNLQWLRIILSSQPAAVLGPVISPDLWQDQAGQNAATQFLQNYTLIPLRATPTDVMNVQNVGVTHWSSQTPLPQTALYISVRPANQATSAPQIPAPSGPPQPVPASQTPGAPQAPNPSPPDYATTEDGTIMGPPAPPGWHSIHPRPPGYATALMGTEEQAGRQIRPQDAAVELSQQQHQNRRAARLMEHFDAVRRANPEASTNQLVRLIGVNYPPEEAWVPPPRQLPPAFNSSGGHNWDVPEGTYDESVLADQGTNAADLRYDHSVVPVHEVVPRAPQRSLGPQALSSPPAQPSASTSPAAPAQSLPIYEDMMRRNPRRFDAQTQRQNSSSSQSQGQRRFNPLPPDNGEGSSQPRQPPGPPPPPAA